MYIFIAIISFMFFLGCTPQGDGILGSQNSVVEQADQKTLQAPFPFDIVADTISYNSCVYQGSSTIINQAGIPGLKIGASEGFADKTGSGAVKSGLKLRRAFLDYIGQNFKPSFPSTTITPQQVKNVLEQADSAKNTYLQFSVRLKSNLNIYVDLINPAPADLVPDIPRDVQFFDKKLNTSYLAYQLTKDVKYLASGNVLSESPRVYNLSSDTVATPVEATFGLTKNLDPTFPGNPDAAIKESDLGVGEQYADLVRQKFSSSGADKVLLTAVFAGNNLDSLTTPTSNTVSVVRRPTGAAANLAYGRGYALKFASKSTTGKAGWIKNILTEIKEIDLINGNVDTLTSWDCRKNFVIVKSNHWNNKRFKQPTCAPFISSDLTAARQEDIQLIRRHYSQDSWNIGLFIPATSEPAAGRSHLQICLAPVDLNCYLPTTGILEGDPSNAIDVGINYDPDKECYLTSHASLNVTYTTAGTPDQRRSLGRCAQYASICKRTGSNY